MMVRLLLLFTLLPMAELMLLIWVKDHTSWSFTILLVLFTGFLGASLARWQGLWTLRRMQQDLQEGRMPTDSLLDGVLILVAGAVLITPGILTDAFGFSLLIPPLRSLVKRYLVYRFKSRFRTDSYGQPGTGPNLDQDRIIDVKIVKPEEETE